MAAVVPDAPALHFLPHDSKRSIVPLSEALAAGPLARHACHVAVLAETSPGIHTVLMQARFDGNLGFPGGFRGDPTEGLAQTACRKVLEELGVAIAAEDLRYFYTERQAGQEGRPALFSHLFTKSVTEAELEQLQQGVLSSKDKREVVGTIRVPLYVLKDGKGLPRFLRNSFAGNAKDQLLNVVAAFKLVDQEKLDEAVEGPPQPVQHPRPPGADAVDTVDLLVGLRGLPKVELHSHFGGACRVATIAELLQGKHPDPEARAQAMVIPRGAYGVPVEPTIFEGSKIVHEAGVFSSQATTRRAAREYLEDCEADGIAYVELRTDDVDRAFLDWILEGFRDASAAGVSCVARLILSLKRDGDPRLAKRVASNAVALKAVAGCGQIGGVVGVDFGGGDALRSPFSEDFAAAVRDARAAGLAFVPHFAEASGEGDLEGILAEGPVRLGNAVFMDEQPGVGRCIRERRLGIECCLVSNLNTMFRDGHLPLAERPARYHRMFLKWVAEGHPIALCTDNRTHTGSLTSNYSCAVDAIGGSPEEQARAAWRLAADAVELILGGEDQKQRLRSLLFEHPWHPSAAL